MHLEVNITKNFSGFSLQAEFNIQSKSCGVFGPSGSGKSTLMHLLAGLQRPDRGRISLCGDILFDASKKIDLPPEERRIGIVFQHAHLFPHLNVRQNLFYGWKRTGRGVRQVDPDALIEVLHLENLLKRTVGPLSGGEKQRVALARTVLACPRLILMDEPLNGLDGQLKYQIIPYLKKVFSEFNIPLLFISHSMQEMRLLTEEVLVLDRGRVNSPLPVEQIARREFGTGDRGYTNLLSLHQPRKEGDLWRYRWGKNELIATVSGTPGENVFELGSRDITLFKRYPEATSARNLITCRVNRLFGGGNRIGVEMVCKGGRLVSQIVPDSLRELEIREGLEVTAVIKASALRRLC